MKNKRISSFILACLASVFILSCSVLTKGTNSNQLKIEKLPNGNYIYENLDLSVDDEKSLKELEVKLNPKYEALGFFWSCYGKNNNKFRHGRIWGGGCCTSDPKDEDDCPEFILAMAGNARVEIDKIMAKYMGDTGKGR